MSPTQRTKARLLAMKMRPWVVEYFNFYANKRVDLYNFADIVAVGNGEVRFIQCCAASSHAARRTKILSEPMALECVKSGVVVEVWSWGKKGKAGKRKLWEVRIERLLENDFNEHAAKSRRTIGPQGRESEEQEESTVQPDQREEAVPAGEEER